MSTQARNQMWVHPVMQLLIELQCPRIASFVQHINCTWTTSIQLCAMLTKELCFAEYLGKYPIFFYYSHSYNLTLSPSVYVKQSHSIQFSSLCDKVWCEMIKCTRPSDLHCFWKDSEESRNILSLHCLIPFPLPCPPAICCPGHGYFLLFICSITGWPFLWQLEIGWLKRKL